MVFLRGLDTVALITDLSRSAPIAHAKNYLDIIDRV